MVRIECTCLWGLLYLCSYPCAMCSFCIRAIMYVDIMQNKPLSIYLSVYVSRKYDEKQVFQRQTTFGCYFGHLQNEFNNF